MSNPEFFAARIRSAKTESDIKAIIKEASDNPELGEPGIKHIRRVAHERKKEIEVRHIIGNHWNRQHRVNGAQQCQRAIAATEDWDELEMRPDPYGKETKIPHKDPNAIALYNEHGRVGYISAKPEQFGGRDGGLVKWLSGRISAGEKWRVFVLTKVGQGKKSMGLRIYLVQISGQPVKDWPEDVQIEAEEINPPSKLDVQEMKKKMDELFQHRQHLGPDAKKKLFKIRSFWGKFGTFTENYLDWLDEQIKNLQIIMDM